LVEWIEGRFDQRVSAVLITHSHYDRIAGTTVFRQRGARVVAHQVTRRLANEQGLPLPDTLSGIAEPGTATRFGSVEVFYGGPGHSVDNLMVWIPDAGILFGGCAVRAASATSLGNVAHADLTQWPETLRRAQERYGAARIVVPGHGDPGDVGLLAHTLSLFSR
jgi:glyoxylase-like metal-dependent hydrolase (beta-lactamase superfamily II)